MRLDARPSAPMTRPPEPPSAARRDAPTSPSALLGLGDDSEAPRDNSTNEERSRVRPSKGEEDKGLPFSNERRDPSNGDSLGILYYDRRFGLSRTASQGVAKPADPAVRRQPP